MSALELKRHLGVCYDTVWKLKHKIMRFNHRFRLAKLLPRQIRAMTSASFGQSRNCAPPTIFMVERGR